MSYTNEEFGRKLYQEIAKGYDIVKISRWSYGVFFNHMKDLSPTQRNVLEELFRMEDDPQFEYTEQELKLLAEMLISGEENPIKRINDMKFTGDRDRD